MSEVVVGEVDRFPLVTLTLKTPSGDRTLDFLVDTGFDGELAIPSSFETWLGAPEAYQTVLFANGHEVRTGVLQCQLTWGDAVISAYGMYINSDRPLLGLELLQNHRLTVDVYEGGEVTIEEID